MSLGWRLALAPGATSGLTDEKQFTRLDMALRLRLVTVLFLSSWTTSWVLAAQPLAEKSLALEPLRTFTGHADAVRSVAFSADGTMKLWNLTEARTIATLSVSSDVSSVALSGDRKSMAAGSGSGAVAIWYLRENVERRVLAGHRSAVHAAAFSPDSGTLASASLDGTVKLWDVATGRCLANLYAHEKKAWTLAFSPDGKPWPTGTRCSTPRKARSTHRTRFRLAAFSPRPWNRPIPTWPQMSTERAPTLWKRAEIARLPKWLR
jgi:WD40 repeat protein